MNGWMCSTSNGALDRRGSAKQTCHQIELLNDVITDRPQRLVSILLRAVEAQRRQRQNPAVTSSAIEGPTSEARAKAARTLADPREWNTQKQASQLCPKLRSRIESSGANRQPRTGDRTTTEQGIVNETESTRCLTLQRGAGMATLRVRIPSALLIPLL